jgi:hypothetical protein
MPPASEPLERTIRSAATTGKNDVALHAAATTGKARGSSSLKDKNDEYFASMKAAKDAQAAAERYVRRTEVFVCVRMVREVFVCVRMVREVFVCVRMVREVFVCDRTIGASHKLMHLNQADASQPS